jgi:hypothetical protein
MAYLDTLSSFHRAPGWSVVAVNPALGLKRPEYECGPAVAIKFWRCNKFIAHFPGRPMKRGR